VASKGAMWRGDTCLFCGVFIPKDEFPVMVKSGMRPEYAHKECVLKFGFGPKEEEEDALQTSPDPF
jgi:hypothetical protein